MPNMNNNIKRCVMTIAGAGALSVAAFGGAAAADLPPVPPQAQVAPPRYAPPPGYYPAPQAEEYDAYPPPPPAYAYPPPVAYDYPPPAYYQYAPPPVAVVPQPYYWRPHYWGGPHGRFIAGGYDYERPFGHPFERFPEHAWGRSRGW